MKTISAIKPGDKIDLFLTGIEKDSKIYKSSISDILKDELWEITMPVANGRIVLFQVGTQCDIVVYSSNKTMYQTTIEVMKRYKKDGLYFIAVELVKDLTKIQRRHFFRLECDIDMTLYNITMENIEKLDVAQIVSSFKTQKNKLKNINAVILDISGGGIRFSSYVDNIPGSYVIVEFTLKNKDTDESMLLLCQIIDSRKNENIKGIYITRAKFLFDNLAEREKIVKYVFDEERYIRRKEMG